MDDDEDAVSFSLGQQLSVSNSYPVNTSIANQYHAWAAAAAAASSSSTVSSNNSTSGLPNHFSPVSPSGHGVASYPDHLGLHPSQSAVDMLSVRLGQGDYHTGQADRLGQSDSYYQTGQSDIVSRHGQSDYHDHLGSQSDRHALSIDVYHHVAASSSSASQQDRLGQADYHSAQQSDRLTQADYHTGQQDRLGQSDYHSSSQQDRLGQLQDYHATQSDRLAGLGKQDYHTGGQTDRLGGQTSGNYQVTDRGLGGQADYHTAQVDLDAVGMHPDFDRRHLDVSMLPKDLVDSGQRGTALDYLSGQSSRDPLASLHRDIVGLQRELDLSVGQSVSPPSRSASDLAASSYGLDPVTLPRDLSPYSQRDLDRAVLSADVVGQSTDSTSRTAGGSATNAILHPQDLSNLSLTGTRDVLDMTALTRQSGGRDDLGRVRDVIHRPRDIQRALEALGSLESANGPDLSLTTNSVSKSASRTYPTTSRLLTSSKRQIAPSSQAADSRTSGLSAATGSAATSSSSGVNFIPMASSRDPLGLMAPDPNAGSCSARLGSSTDFSRQQANKMSRLRRELTAPYTDLSLHHTLLSSSSGVTGFKTGMIAPPDQLVCNDVLVSSRERLYEMMKQNQFCDAVLATLLHTVRVHKAVLCSASAYLCGVLSQTNMGKKGGRCLTVQFKAEIPATSLSAFIDFIYLGRVALSAKNVRDLHVMARCLHMETLKKATEEVLWASGLSSDNIPELLLLEQHIDKRDQACMASLPTPSPPPPPSRDMAVNTDQSLTDLWMFEVSCQTEETSKSFSPRASQTECAVSDASTLKGRAEGSVGVNSRSVENVCLSVSTSAHTQTDIFHTSNVNTSSGMASLPVNVLTTSSVNNAQTTVQPTTSTTVTVTKPHSHHKKQMASEATRSNSITSDISGSKTVISEANRSEHLTVQTARSENLAKEGTKSAGFSVDDSKSVADISRSKSLTGEDSRSNGIHCVKEQLSSLSMEDEMRTSSVQASSFETQSNAYESATHAYEKTHSDSTLNTPDSSATKTSCTKPRKKNTLPSAVTSSTSSDFIYTTSSQTLPGQTLRPVYHSYGTRAAARTPTRLSEPVNSQPPKVISKPKGESSSTNSSRKEEEKESGKSKEETDSDANASIQSQIAKHKGRMKKGRIAAAVLSEALRNANNSESSNTNSNVSNTSESDASKQTTFSSESQLESRELAVSNQPQFSSSSSSSSSASNTHAPMLVSSLETAVPCSSQSAPKGYRKRLIQSVESESLRQNEKLNAERVANVDAALDSAAAEANAASTSAEATSAETGHGANTLFEEDPAILLQVSTVATPSVDDSVLAAEIHEASDQSVTTVKRKKKGKARRMLLSSPGGSGGVRVRAPPKKRAKMELELEKLMREETEEEDEEEENTAAVPRVAEAAANAAAAVFTSTAEKGEQPAPSGKSGKRIKLPTKPGKPARWITNDKLVPFVIQLNAKGGDDIDENERVYTCCLCDNEFMLPKRCISHVMTTHQIPEHQVVDNIHVGKREGLKLDDVTTACDICGYRSRDGTTYYLHYHKYFKHGVPLPKGWSAFKCDLCGKELFTKFQLKDHKRAHIEKTPFVCEICGAGFQRRSCLHSHVFHRHKNEKKHHCERCDKYFKTRTQLSVHLRTHTGERPFSCPQCDYTATTRGNIRVHLKNRHKLPSTDIENIMAELKPNCDTSVYSLAWKMTEENDAAVNNTSPKKDSAEKQKRQRKKKKKGNASDSTSPLKTKTGEGSMQDERVTSPVFVSVQDRQNMVMDPSAMELFIKTATDPSVNTSNETDVNLGAGMDLDVGDGDAGEDLGGKDVNSAEKANDSLLVAQSVMLASQTALPSNSVSNSQDIDGNSIELSSAEGFSSADAMAGTVTFLPPSLESVFQQQTQGDGVATATTTTIIVPDSLVHSLQQQQLLQSHHKQHLYHHPQIPVSQFTGFTVMSAGPPLQTVNPQDLVVTATTLNSGSLKPCTVVDFGDMGVGVGMVEGLGDGSQRQESLNSLDLTLQTNGGAASGSGPGSLPQQPGSPDPQPPTSVSLYMQHSPISPAPSISPTPVYVAVTPTPLTPTKQEGDDLQDQTTSVASADTSTIVLDHSHQQQLQAHQYDASILQAYYQQQFYSQNY